MYIIPFRKYVRNDGTIAIQRRDLTQLRKGYLSYTAHSDARAAELIQPGIFDDDSSPKVTGKFIKPYSAQFIEDDGYPLPDENVSEIFSMLCGTAQLWLKDKKLVSFFPDPYSLTIEGTVVENMLMLHPKVIHNQKEYALSLKSNIRILSGNRRIFLLAGHAMYMLTSDYHFTDAASALAHDAVPLDAMADLIGALNGSPVTLRLPESIKPDKEKENTLRPQIVIAEDGNALRLELMFSYYPESRPVHPAESISELVIPRPGMLPLTVTRQKESEQKFMNQFMEIFSSYHAGGNLFSTLVYIRGRNIRKIILDVLPGFCNPWQIIGLDGLKQFNYCPGTYELSITFKKDEKREYFLLEGCVIHLGKRNPLTKVHAALKKNLDAIELKDGQKGIIPEFICRDFREIFLLGSIIEKNIAVEKVFINRIHALSTFPGVRVDAQSAEHIRRIFSRDQSALPDPPLSCRKLLRPYQTAGFHWLLSLHAHGFGGILADDMGLGKTIQVLALLEHLYRSEDNPVHGKTLIVVPASLIFNWLREAEKHTPSIQFIVFTGINRKVLLPEITAPYDGSARCLVLTTYRTAVNDADTLREIQWEYIILDEAQNIKNPDSVTAHTLHGFSARHRLTMSGTPVENSIMDLWSQMNFCNPGLLGHKNYFLNTFQIPIEKNGSNTAGERLKELSAPFILRRKKTSVLKELPEKEEIDIFVEMSEDEQAMYDEVKQKFRRSVFRRIDEEGIEKSKIHIFEGMLRLRQVCCHPALIDPAWKGGRPAKFSILFDKINEIVSEGNKALIFSQFTSLLALLRADLDQENIPYAYLDGSTTDREAAVNQFQNDPSCGVFLISLKAGGVGLNLSAANYVFIYDPWWNPAAETQAVDRTHRYGQNKKVFSCRFITVDSVEEHVLRLQKRKKQLAENIVQEDAGIAKLLTLDDIKKIFG